MSYKAIHQTIDDWYQCHGRFSLPWRNTSNPYHIYISEVMLQQTQVKTVLNRFYAPFLAAFPSLKALAKADLQSVLKAWEGLGYYSRAHNLHKAAMMTAPALPDDFEALQTLPGIGKNTAAAICAFAFRQAIPVMEANLRRVLSRFFALEYASESLLWESAYRLLNRDDPYNYNQAMMDIGAMVCLAKAPKCSLCPLQSSCMGRKSPEQYGRKQTKKAPERCKDIFVYSQNDRLYLVCRGEPFLKGMYGFLECDKGKADISTLRVVKIGHVTQKYSHFTLQATVYLTQKRPFAEMPAGCWYELNRVYTLPMSEVDKKILVLFQSNQHL